VYRYISSMIISITFTKEVMFYSLFVSLSVFLCVCLLARSCKMVKTAHRIFIKFTRNVSLDEEKQMKFLMPSTSGSERKIFECLFNTTRPVHSSTIWLMSLEKLTGSSQKFHDHICIFVIL